MGRESTVASRRFAVCGRPSTAVAAGLLLALWVLGQPVVLAAQTRATHAPRGGQSASLPAPVAVTTGPHSTVETAIAIDPANPDHIVGAGLSIIGDPSQRRITNFSFVTWDGGRSWTSVALPNPEERIQGDDGVVVDHTGRVYRTYISFKHLYDSAGVGPKTGLFAAVSDDGGLTYTPAPVVDHINTIVPFEDKPYPGIDLSPDSPYRGRLYVAWTRFTRYGSASPEDSSYIFVATSADGGRTFSRPVRVPGTAGDALDGDDTVEGAVPAPGPDGTVYMTWSGPRGIDFSRSLDGGATWDTARAILEQPGGWSFDIAGLTRANGMPVTAVDISDGPHRGTVYVNWADLRNSGGEPGDVDIFLSRSDDGGRSWSEPLRVNQDPPGNGRDQFFSWMSVDPVDGSVNIVYYDRREGDGSGVHVYLARSTDGGRSFEEHRISEEAFVPVEGRFFGDYIGVSAYGGRVACLWPHAEERADVLRAVVIDFE